MEDNANVSRFRTSNGGWMGSLEIRRQLSKEHPKLPRSQALNAASGRYCREIKVSRTYQQRLSVRLPLEKIPIAELDSYLTKCPADLITAVTCLREDDNQSRQIEKTLEKINNELFSNSLQASDKTSTIKHTKLHKIVKVEMSESRLLYDKYGITCVPVFLMFMGCKFVLQTSLGGSRLRTAPITKNFNLVHKMNYLPRVLLIDSIPKRQLEQEKILKKEGFEWDLAINTTAAVGHLNDAISGRNYGIVFLADDLAETDYQTLVQGGLFKLANAVFCIILSSKTVSFSLQECNDCRNTSTMTKSMKLSEACPHCGLVSQNIDYLPRYLKDLPISKSFCAVSRHIKSGTMHRLAEKWNSTYGNGENMNLNCIGLTSSRLLDEVSIALENGRSNTANQPASIHLSTQDTNIKGRCLVRSTTRST